MSFWVHYYLFCVWLWWLVFFCEDNVVMTSNLPLSSSDNKYDSWSSTTISVFTTKVLSRNNELLVKEGVSSLQHHLITFVVGNGLLCRRSIFLIVMLLDELFTHIFLSGEVLHVGDMFNDKSYVFYFVGSFCFLMYQNRFVWFLLSTPLRGFRGLSFFFCDSTSSLLKLDSIFRFFLIVAWWLLDCNCLLMLIASSVWGGSLFLLYHFRLQLFWQSCILFIQIDGIPYYLGNAPI